MIFSEEEFLSLSQGLEQNHSIFSQMWRLGKPLFCEEIETAQVVFDETGKCINFEINYNFWKDKSSAEKSFIISHECLHVLLNHGSRLVEMVDQQIAGIAVDLVVNQMLITNFGFNKQDVDPNNQYYWIDSIFPPEMPKNKSAEFYYKELEVLIKNMPQIIQGNTVDKHNQLPNVFDFLNEDDHLYQAISGLSGQEKNSLANLISPHNAENQKAGTGVGGLLKILNIPIVQKKRKWETVIKNWAKSAIKFKEEDQWVMTNRRYVMLSKDLILPSEAELEFSEKDRIQVWFFQDTSGSCYHLAERFFKAALSLPEDKFDVRGFCFDTRVYPVDLKKHEIRGGGGTSFTCIDHYINKTVAEENIKYPTCFIITDGMGDHVYPPNPKCWHWFLSYNYTGCIPKESYIYNLSNFE